MVNWITTIGGLLLAFGLGANQVADIPQEYRWIFALMAAAGAIVLGGGAKDARVHSTADEVNVATRKQLIKDNKDRASDLKLPHDLDSRE